jgi:hypothetical protein
LLATKWNLPQCYTAAIAYHHYEDLSFLTDEKEKALIRIIAIADSVALFFGIGLRRKLDIYKLPYRELGISEKAFDELVWEVNDIYEEYINSLTF